MIQVEAQQRLQEVLNQYRVGIDVVTVKLQDVDPPNQVSDAFKDVISAQQDKERLINEAYGYANDVVPKARGQAAQLVNEAEGFREARVREATRTRVLKAIEELNYHPNLHARSLAGGQSRSLGVIVSNIENPFFLDIYKTVEVGAHEAGYDVILANTDYKSDRLVTSIRLMLGRRVAGLAAIVSEMDAALIQELSSQRIPVVFYDVGAPRQ